MALQVSKYKDVSFSSQFRYERIKSKGHVDFFIGGGDWFKTVTIPHGLGYKPFFRLFIRFPNSNRIFQQETGSQTYDMGGGGYQIEGIGSDATNITVQFGSYMSVAGTGTIYYRIYEESQ